MVFVINVIEAEPIPEPILGIEPTDAAAAAGGTTLRDDSFLPQQRRHWISYNEKGKTNFTDQTCRLYYAWSLICDDR